MIPVVYIYVLVIIIIGMNVVDNLKNSVYVINKPCMSSRDMCLLPQTTLHSDSEQYLLNKISKSGQGQHSGYSVGLTVARGVGRCPQTENFLKSAA